MNLRQLSALLGLSPTTVSRALNGYPEVNEDTRQRIVAAARKHGYAPDPKARQLATGKTMSIGHVLTVRERHEITNPIFADFLAGAGEGYANHGYDIRITVVPDAEEAEAYRKFATRGYVDGVVVHGPLPHDPRISLLNEIGIPFVVHGRTGTDDTKFSWVDVNNRKCFLTGAEHLIGLGHRTIGLVNGIESHDFALRRHLGMVQALEHHGLALDPDHLVAGEMTQTTGYHGALKMLEGPHPPSAIMTSSILSAIGVQRAAEERGMVLGQDLSLVTFDDDLSYFRNEGREPLFTALKSSVRNAGKLCAEMLMGLIAAPDSARQTRLLEAELVLGQSSGPKRRA